MQVALAELAMKRALQVHELLVSDFAPVADSRECGMRFDDLQDATLDAVLVLVDMNLLPSFTHQRYWSNCGEGDPAAI
jgi:hypothetical protein